MHLHILDTAVLCVIVITLNKKDPCNNNHDFSPEDFAVKKIGAIKNPNTQQFTSIKRLALKKHMV